MDARSDVNEETENQRTELGGHQHSNTRGILARTRCWHYPHGLPCPFGSFLSDPDFEDREQAQQKLPWLMAENGIACTTCAYLSPILASLLHFIIASVSALVVNAVQIQMMDHLNEGGLCMQCIPAHFVHD